MTRTLAALMVRWLTGARLRDGLPRPGGPRVYFANHSSHLDFVVIWSVLPAELRERARPVAAADYWSRGRLRSWLAGRLFHAVLVERREVSRENNPLEKMAAVLQAGGDLILFPEGTRNPGGGLLPFKPGLYHLAKKFPGLELMPVWLENLNRILPRGEFLPVPVMGGVHFRPLLAPLVEGESKADFLARARGALEGLS